MRPNRTKQLSTVAFLTCIVVTRVKQVVRMRVGSGQTVELSTAGLFFQKFYIGEKVNSSKLVRSGQK